jgi:hypothetical protein
MSSVRGIIPAGNEVLEPVQIFFTANLLKEVTTRYRVTGLGDSPQGGKP